jgi:FkbM family methyltransferase
MNLKQAALAIMPQAVINYHYTRQIEKSTINDERDLACLPAIIKPDWVSLDLGANIGRYTKHLSKLSACVISVEPAPLTFAALANSVKVLGMKNVETVCCAVSDKNGYGAMQGKNIYEAELVEGSDVPVRTVDDICSNLSRLDFIKCDVEGHEMKVLQGAKTIISKFRPMWLIETPWDSPVFSFMEQSGYACYVEDAGNIRPRTPQERKTNYFFKGK